MPKRRNQGDIRERIKGQLWAVWEGIAFDLLDARREEAKLDPGIGDPNFMPRGDVVDVVMDQVYGRTWPEDPEASETYNAMSREERVAIVRETFPDAEYGI